NVLVPGMFAVDPSDAFLVSCNTLPRSDVMCDLTSLGDGALFVHAVTARVAGNATRSRRMAVVPMVRGRHFKRRASTPVHILATSCRRATVNVWQRCRTTRQ